MNTRIELWRDYRENIERNVSLQKAVIESNQILNILYSRLIRIYPEYEEKYESKLSQFEAMINQINQVPLFESINISSVNWW